MPILERPWQLISMDFISGFSKVDGFKFIMVMVDRFFKYLVFIPALHECLADIVVELFLKNIVKYFGISDDIVSGRESQFIGRF